MNEYYAIIRRSPELKHFGIIGMRWGVKRKYRKEAEALREKLRAQAAAQPIRIETDKMRSLWSQVEKMERNFYKNPQLVDKHRKILANKLAKQYGNQFNGGFKEAYKSYYNGYKYGDLDQGDSSTFTNYRKTNQQAKQKYDGLIREYGRESIRANPWMADLEKRQRRSYNG